MDVLFNPIDNVTAIYLTCIFIACRMRKIPFIKLGYIQRSQKSVMDATGLV